MKSRSYQKALLEAMRNYIDLTYFCSLGKQRKSRWSNKYLINQSILMSYSCQNTLSSRFDDAREALVAMYPNSIRPGDSYQSFTNARRKISGMTYDLLQEHLRGKHRDIATERFGWQAFAADGTKHDLPRTAANQKYFGVSGKANTHPQISSVVLYNMATGLPWAWDFGEACASERDQLSIIMSSLPINALIVADSGFIGFDYINEIVSHGRNFLFRVGANKTLLTDLGLEIEQDGDNIVWLWPNDKRKQKPFKLRLIKLKSKSENSDVYLVTNVLDEEKLSDETAGVFYEMRWGVEVFFRDFKQTMDNKKLLSRSPKQALEELKWAMISILLLGLMSVEAIVSAGKDPLSWAVALSLQNVRHAMRTRKRWRFKKDFGIRLNVVKDEYQRRTSKKSRGYPRKKNDSPPKPPKIRRAKTDETIKAKRLYDAA